ncbi:MAG: TetR/AcrR family transcriptional regulator [Candidatus Lokiarchaeota archaeon]
MANQDQTKRNGKKTRSRSPERRDGFTLGRLARRLGMNKNNLYNYIESKRELWIAIRKKFYEQYRNENRKIIKEYGDTNIDTLLRLFAHFFEFAEKDYSAFRMMHIIPSPPSNKVGPFEKEYKQFSFLDGTTRLIQKAIDKGEIKEKNAALLSFFMFSLLLGSTMVEWAMREIEETNNKEGKKVEEYLQFGGQNFTSKEFRNYILRKIEKGFTDPNLVMNEFEYK